VAAADHRDVTYGNWRKPVSPGIGRLGLAGTIVLFAGLILIVVTSLLSLLVGAAVLGLLAVALVPLLIRDRDGRTMLQNAIARIAWTRGRRAGQHIYRSGPLSITAHGTFRLPGLNAGTAMYEAQDSWARPFGLIEMPATGHYTAVFETGADGAALVDQGQVDTWVAYWGRWLATLCYEPSLAGASVTIETAPDPGTRLAREVDGQLNPAAPGLAREVLRELVRAYPAGSAQISARIAVTYSAAMRPGGRRRNYAEMAREIGTRLPGLGEGLANTGAGEARPMTAAQLAEAVRTAYDPAAQPLIEQARSGDGGSGLDWANAGPVAAQEAWDHYVHDGAASITWGMIEAPRGEVLSSVLHDLLAPHRAIARKRVTICYRPHDPADAPKIVERDKKDATFRLGAADPAARVTVDVDAARRDALAEAKGAGVVRFALLVTATVTAVEDLPDAAAAVDVLGATARLRLRRMWGSQATAFAAGLPVGVILPDHVQVPQAIRDAS
jgi:hypothetical protein